jgi:hypothetical protein
LSSVLLSKNKTGKESPSKTAFTLSCLDFLSDGCRGLKKYTEKKYKRNIQQFQRFYSVTVQSGNHSIFKKSLGPNLWISHDWEHRYASVGHRYIFKKVGAWIRKPVSIWCDHHLPQRAQHISFA